MVTKTQNQIKKTLSCPDSIDVVRQALACTPFESRNDLARLVCERFGFLDTTGQYQLSGCLVALRKLEKGGHFVLPPALHSSGSGSPLRLSQPLEQPQAVPAKVGEVGHLTLVLVNTEALMRIWNEMMITEHPLGAGPIVGRQMRYLIGSDHGWLGGFGFASAALQLADRDAWIGWDAQQRLSHLHGIVGMCRFLIRPGVRCQNLASKVLSMAVQALVVDFERKYNYRPWLVETFVDESLYDGSSYKAANWQCVGKTKGRGRQDRYSKKALRKKAIYVYQIDDGFRQAIGLPKEAGLGPLGPADGLDSEQWTQNEFGDAPLGDARLSSRLVSSAAIKAKMPDRAFSGASKGDWPAVKGYYRFIDHPDESAVNMTHILLPHQQQTIRRMQGQNTVLCIQDGSDLNYNNLDKCTDLGVIGTNQTNAQCRGLHLHSTFAVAPNGLPLGVLKADCTAPQASPKDKDKQAAASIPIEEKKTFCWIEHHRNLVEMAVKMPQTRLVDVCDREADFFELFDEQRQNPRVELLVRAKHNRNLTGDSLKLFDAVRQTEVVSYVQVNIPRQSARPKKSKQKARPKRPGRNALLAVRYLQIELNPKEGQRDKEPIKLWVINAVEENPPAQTKPVQWFLLTTINLTSVQDAEQCLRWYCLRWRIEDWHRVLKSGCKIQELAHETADRLRRAIAINLVIAWRIMLMTLLGRETPNLPAGVLFSDVELRTLRTYAKKQNLTPPVLLGDAVRLIAQIGGYLGRNNDPPPGHQILWLGYREFQFLTLGFSLSEDN